VQRTINSIEEIFDESIDNIKEIVSIVPISVYKLVRCIGIGCGESSSSVDKAIQEGLCNVLDSASLAGSATNIHRLLDPVDSLDVTEIIHSRKLVYPNQGLVESRLVDALPSLEVGIVMVVSIHLKSIREALIMGHSEVDVDASIGLVESLVSKYIGSTSSDMCHSINAMIKDIKN
jgi:hypothetical protein